MLAQCRLWRFMASDTKATSHKEDLPEKETPESAPDRPLLDFSDAAVKKAPPHRQETRLGPPRVCGGGPANQVRLVQLAQVAARRRARDIGAVSKLSGRQRLAAHKGAKHRRSRSVTYESGHFHQICRRDHP